MYRHPLQPAILFVGRHTQQQGNMLTLCPLQALEPSQVLHGTEQTSAYDLRPLSSTVPVQAAVLQSPQVEEQSLRNTSTTSNQTAPISKTGSHSTCDKSHPPAAAASTQTACFLSENAAVVAVQTVLLVLLLIFVRIHNNIKAAAASCKHRLPVAAIAAAVSNATLLCNATCSAAVHCYTWLQTDAHRSHIFVRFQAKPICRQLVLCLLWSLALTNGVRTDPHECLAACALANLPQLTCTAESRRAARVIRRAAAAAASHLLAASTAAGPPLSSIKFGLLLVEAASMLKSRVASFIASTAAVYNHLSSFSKQALQACLAGAVAVTAYLAYTTSACLAIAGVTMLPVLMVDRCIIILVHCWPTLLVLFTFKVRLKGHHFLPALHQNCPAAQQQCKPARLSPPFCMLAAVGYASHTGACLFSASIGTSKNTLKGCVSMQLLRSIEEWQTVTAGATQTVAVGPSAECAYGIEQVCCLLPSGLTNCLPNCESLDAVVHAPCYDV